MTLRAFAGGCALAAGTVACVCSVQAADLPVAPRPAPAAPVVYAPPPYNWSGFYVGGNIGGGFANSSWSDPFTAATDTFSKNGFHRWRANRRQRAIQLAGGGRRRRFRLGNRAQGQPVAETAGQFRSTPKPNGLRPRPAASAPRSTASSFYGKAGAAFAHDDQQFGRYCRRHKDSTRPEPRRLDRRRRPRIRHRPQLVGQIEYDYLGFGSEALNLPTPTFPAYTSNASLNVQEIKAGLNFRFGGGD